MKVWTVWLTGETGLVTRNKLPVTGYYVLNNLNTHNKQPSDGELKKKIFLKELLVKVSAGGL